MGAISGEIRRFIIDNIDSVAQLEALLLLREGTGQTWNSNAVARRLYIPPKTAAALLRVLHERELIMLADPDGKTYRYGPTTAERVRLVGQLAITYAQRLVAVTLLIHAKASRSIEGVCRRFSAAGRRRVMAAAIYVLCSLTAFGCAGLLLRSFQRSGLRLLLWSGLCFLFLGLDNAITFSDLVVFPEVDLFLLRNLAAAIGIGLLIYGLVWDSSR